MAVVDESVNFDDLFKDIETKLKQILIHSW
jgi:hypothetical protein